MLYIGVGLAAMGTSLGYLIQALQANLRFKYEKLSESSEDLCDR